MKPLTALIFFASMVAHAFLLTGCTSALWNNETFAHHYRPANPVNLRLSYSTERKDILVQYDESRDGGEKWRTRCYWLEPNTVRVNRERKPHFVSLKPINDLIPIPIGETVAINAQPGLMELYVVARRDDDCFTLYSGKEEIDPYKLPRYVGTSRRAKQIVLTPLALGIDATIVGAVIGFYAAPQLLTLLNR